MLYMTEAVFFDLTGTLQPLDFDKMYSAYMNLLGRFPSTSGIMRKDFERRSQQAYDLYQVGALKTDYAFYEKLFELLEVKVRPQEFKQILSKHYEIRKGFISLAPGLERTLTGLKKDFRLAILSNGVKSWADRDWKMLGLNHKGFFEKEVFSQQSGFLKPRKEAFKYALEEMNVSAGKAAMVGDNDVEDIFGGKSVGMKTVYVSSGGKKCSEADYIIKELQEIIELKQKLKEA